MDMEKLSQFTTLTGIVLLDDTPVLISREKFVEFSALVVAACAQVQMKRSCQRHGYDKYEDAEAIVDNFGVDTNLLNMRLQ